MNDQNVVGGGDAALESSDVEAVGRLRDGYDRIRNELAKVIVGQNDVIDQLLVALLSNGHVILEGVPGLAKTLMISTLAQSLDLSFSRIQFTPDLMPSDITGTDVIQEDKATGQRAFSFLGGPIFANVILADEINRTPPKTQAALLEAMQERQVTVGNERHVLPQPFFVLATQNPIEQEGTYPLPEAQQDRFMFKVYVDYPSYDQEYDIAERTTAGELPTVSPVFGAEELLTFQRLVRRIPAAPDIVRHALDLVRATRPNEENIPPFIKTMLTWGAGPRAVQALLLGGKALAVLRGRHHVAADDIRDLARPVMRHRIVTNYSAQAEGYTPDRIIDDLLEAIRPNETEAARNERFGKLLTS
ncbi:MAG: MoxR family ATPase [Planctomycetes bacterium]|nr:MoxR family ATPase [Planctomycetota bacterium]